MLQVPSQKTAGVSAPQIDSINLAGKNISCILSDRGPLALLEAVWKVFFPTVEDAHFKDTIIDVVKLPLFHLTKDESLAFDRYYELPAGSLTLPMAVRIVDFKRKLPKIRTLLHDKT